MSIITRFLAVVTEPQFKLARDLMAMAIADGELTYEEKEAMSAICHLEGVDEYKLMEALKGGFENVREEMPNTQQEREGYLTDLIRVLGADGYAAPQELFLFQIIAGRMGLNQMGVIGLFLGTASRRYFEGDAGARILASFLKNYIDPKAKTERENRENLRTIYDTVASHTEVNQDEEQDREVLRQTLARATQTLMENKLLITEFAHVGLNFGTILKEEESRTFRRYCSN